MNSINAYTTQQIADEICKWVRARAAAGGFDNLTSLSIYNNSDGLAFDIRAFDVVFCPKEE